MASIDRSGYVYLGLALACFLAILCIFIVDGYLGVYDILYITYGEYEQKVEFESQQYVEAGEAYFGGEIVAGASALYRYQIDNRTFHPYEGQLIVSLWKGGNRLTDLVNQQVKLASFDSTVIDWAISSEKLASFDASAEEYTNYTIKINFAGKERRVILGYRARGVMVPKPVPGM